MEKPTPRPSLAYQISQHAPTRPQTRPQVLCRCAEPEGLTNFSAAGRFVVVCQRCGYPVPR